MQMKEEQNIEKAITYTNFTNSFWGTVASAHSGMPAYWSPNRDEYLRYLVFSNSFLTTIVHTITQLLYGLEFLVAPRDANVELQNKTALSYDSILQRSTNSTDYEKFIFDLLASDNGGFLYVDGVQKSHLPLRSAPTGLRHLDSKQCQRTNNNTFPVLFTRSNGETVKLHESRIIYFAQMPSPIDEMRGVGISLVSRVFALTNHLLDVSLTESETIGTLNPNEIYVVAGADAKSAEEAFRKSEITSVNEGRKRIGRRVIIGLREPTSKISRILTRSFPDGFDKRSDIEITLSLIALAAGVSPLYLFDSVKSGSTKASASTSISSNSQKLLTWYVQKISSELDNKFLPPLVKVIQPDRDIDTDGVKARIKLNLANSENIKLNNGVINIRTARERLLQWGDLTAAQFAELELQEGRLPSGLPIQSLFFSNNIKIQKLLDLPFDPNMPVDNPELAAEDVQNAMKIALAQAVNGRTAEAQKNARLAYHALLWLFNNYQQQNN